MDTISIVIPPPYAFTCGKGFNRFMCSFCPNVVEGIYPCGKSQDTTTYKDYFHVEKIYLVYANLVMVSR